MPRTAKAKDYLRRTAYCDIMGEVRVKTHDDTELGLQLIRVDGHLDLRYVYFVDGKMRMRAPHGAARFYPRLNLMALKDPRFKPVSTHLAKMVGADLQKPKRAAAKKAA